MIDIPFAIGRCGTTVNNYVLVEQLGQGAFGQVYLGQHTTTLQLRAIKIVSRKKIMHQRSEFMRKLRLRLLQDEGTIMKNCNSPHVIKCYQIVSSEEFEIMVLEYCRDGDLYKHIRAKRRLDEEQAIDILRQLVKGFAELHKNKVIHRDLKSENIFVDGGIFKIGDLGLAKVIPNIMEIQRGTKLGTLSTMAPEVLTKSGYGVKADMWSLGVIFFQMLHGYTPFEDKNRLLIEENIKGGRYKVDEDIVSKKAKQLIDRMLVVDQMNRISWTELYDHRIMRGESFMESEVDIWMCPDFYGQIEAMEKDMKRQIQTQITYVEQTIKEQIDKQRQSVKKSIGSEQEQIVLELAFIIEFQLNRNTIIFNRIVNPLINNALDVQFSEYSWYVLLVLNRCLLHINLFKSSNTHLLAQLCSFKQVQNKLIPLRKLEKQLQNSRNIIIKQLQKREFSFSSRIKSSIDKLINKEDYLRKVFRQYASPDYGMGEQMIYTAQEGRRLMEILQQIGGEKEEKLIQVMQEYQSLAVAQEKYDRVYMASVVVKYL